MNKSNFDTITDDQQRQFSQKNCQAQKSVQAHLDRFSENPKSIIASPNDPNSCEKISQTNN